MLRIVHTTYPNFDSILFQMDFFYRKMKHNSLPSCMAFNHQTLLDEYEICNAFASQFARSSNGFPLDSVDVPIRTIRKLWFASL